MNNKKKIKLFYTNLLKHFGTQSWWPGESRIEIIIGAILTQNTSWMNVEKAINNLKKNQLLDIELLLEIDINKLAFFIKPAGFYNQKAKTIKNFIHFVKQNYNLDLSTMNDDSLEVLRDKLLLIKGIGPETADSILLYAFNKPSFVIDKYTYRVLNRHKIIPEQSSYNEMKELITDSIEINSDIYNEYHALFVKVGKEHCKKTAI